MSDADKEEKQDKNALDWSKDKKIGTDERQGLKINVREANQYRAEKGKFSAGVSGGKKILRRKIVRPQNDEEEDEDTTADMSLLSLQNMQINKTDASNGDNTLLNSLFPEEKQLLTQRTNIAVTQQEENTGKNTALLEAAELSRKVNISRMSDENYAKEMQNAIYNPQQTKLRALQENIAEKVGLKGKITRHNVGNVVEGVSRIQKTTEKRKVSGMTMDDAAKVGKKKMSKNATAELILKKSGQTARLEEIKRQSTAGYVKSADNKGQKKVSYDAEMKKLLKAELRKKAKVH